MKYIEKELKLKIKDLSGLLDYLKKHGAVVLNKSKEKTIRFDTLNKDLERLGVFLRVRAGSKNTITLKEKIGEDKDVRRRKETEFEIEDIEAMAYILDKLGFDYSRTMEKYRINLEYKGAKLSVDELFFGLFLEIEGEEKKIEEIATELGYDPKEKILGTYWDILEEYNREHGTNKKDIQFPNGYTSMVMALL